MNIENISNNETTTFAFGMKNGHIVNISQVEKGLACGCECIGCGSPLIARKGEIKTHHFAHHDGNQNNCMNLYYTNLENKLFKILIKLVYIH